jgi:murein DD-endopeptidase MepM/ murein hydrolase activator NlpD
MRHPVAVYLAILTALSSEARAYPGIGEAKLTLPSGEVLVPFGQQRHPILQVQKFHTGVDYAAMMGELVRAAGAGEVTFAERDGEFGLTVAVTHGDELQTRYGHLSRIAVTVGDCVSADTLVGYARSTGLSAGPRLHFEVRRNGKPVDPLASDH